MHQLIRTTPQGVEKTQGPFKSRRDAAVAAGRVLADNLRTSKAEAQRFSAALSKAPVGETMRHEASGYTFRIAAA